MNEKDLLEETSGTQNSKRTSAKRGKPSPGSGRVNEVGSDIAVPVRIPKSMKDSVKALVKLKRGKISCPEVYACVAMLSFNEIFQDKLDSEPLWEVAKRPLTDYLNKLVSGLLILNDGSNKHDREIVRLEALQDKVEYNYVQMRLYKELRDNLSLLESVEKVLKANNLFE